MTRAQLLASRKIWRTRELSRYKKWHFYRYSSKRPLAERLKLRDKWYKSYVEARDARQHRDKQIAALPQPRAVPLSAVRLVASFEGFSAVIYRDAVGVPTQGYGDTQGLTQKPWSRLYALRRLLTRLNKDYLPAVLAADVHKKLSVRGIGGFTSFVYNVGPGGVAADTEVGRFLRAGNVAGAANAILAWNKAGGRVLAGLDSRRKAERAYILGR